jgi:hypothetical protein
MRKLVILIILLHLVLLAPGYSLHAAELKKVAQAGLKFTDIELSARASGMGEAFTLIGDDADALFHNPAGIAQIQDRKFDLTFGMVSWIADVKLNAFGGVANLGTWGNLGISFFYVDYGFSMGTIPDPPDQPSELGYEETGPLELGAYAAGISYARRLTDKFMIGANARYAYEHLGSTPFADNINRDSTWFVKNETNTIVWDLGTIFYPGFKSLRFGMCIVNFSPAVRYEFEEGRTNSFSLPLTFKMGAAMNVLELFGDYPDYSFLVDFELVHPRDYSQRYHLGGELSILKILKLRAGYKFGYDEEGLCCGAGINVNNYIKLDYAYSAFGNFDFVNRVSLGLAF